MKFISTATLVVFLMLTTLATVSFADDLTPEKEAAIIKLMEITGSKNIGMQMGKAINMSLANSLKAANPKTPEKAFVILADETNKLMDEQIDSLFKSIVPIYNNYFTKAEIDELLAFYETPIGKKTISVLPLITRDSMVVGQNWGKGLVPKLMENLQKRFKAEGIEWPKEQ